MFYETNLNSLDHNKIHRLTITLRCTCECSRTDTGMTYLRQPTCSSWIYLRRKKGIVNLEVLRLLATQPMHSLYGRIVECRTVVSILAVPFLFMFFP